MYVICVLYGCHMCVICVSYGRVMCQMDQVIYIIWRGYMSGRWKGHDMSIECNV